MVAPATVECRDARKRLTGKDVPGFIAEQDTTDTVEGLGELEGERRLASSEETGESESTVIWSGR